jgi:putative glutamine transport system substrate-binding protein
MKFAKKIVCAALILAAVTGTVFAGGKKESAQGPQGAGQIDKIRNAGVLKVGVKTDVPNFGLLNTTTHTIEGFEVDLAELIAKDLLGDAAKVIFTPVTASTRGPLLDNGDIDLVIATFTVTEERKRIYNFSAGYYIDAVGLLVQKASGIGGIADLDGKTVGVAQSSTSRKALENAAADMGASIEFAEFATYPEIKTALDSGQVDAFSVDRSILRGYLDSETVLLDDVFSPQEYGVASKFDNKELASYIDGLIQKWLGDGTIKALTDKYNI